MPKYLPFEIGIDFQTSVSDMVSFRWENRGIIAEFLIPHDNQRVVRVRFDNTIVVRILDEMPLSTEDEATPNEGLMPEHFAYRVQGARFRESQSNAIQAVFRSAEHYRFITGWTCLDVISESAPCISLVPAAAREPG